MLTEMRLMVHERHRWSYMTEQQLARRVKRITKIEKLGNFATLAGENGNKYLLDLVREREEDLYGSRTISSVEPKALKVKEKEAITISKKPEVKKKWEVVKEAEIKKRYLDF